MSRIRQKNQDLIIEVACEQFATHGYAATKMADIAKAADIPKPDRKSTRLNSSHAR